MFATVIYDSHRGFWFAEVDGTHQSVFVHQKSVKQRRRLHLNDRITLDVIPSPVRPGEFEGENVEWVGVCVARQVSEEAVRP